MVQAIVYCDRCARLITPGDIDSGRALSRDGVSICASCLQTMPPAEVEQLSSPRASAAPTSQSRRTPKHKPDAGAGEPRAATRFAPLLGIVMVVTGVLLGIAVTLVVMPGPPEEEALAVPPVPSVPAPLPAVPVTTPEAASVEPAVPSAATSGQDHRAALRARLEPSLQDYAASRAALEKLAGEYNSPDAAPAKALLDELDAQYAEVADRALEAAITKAVTMAARRQFDEAEAAMKDVPSRFAEGPWLAATGRERIDATLADIARMRKLSAEADAKAKADAEAKAREAARTKRPSPAATESEAPAPPSPPAPEGVADDALWTAPGAFQTKLSKSDLDGGALAEWVDGSEKRITEPAIDSVIWTTDGKVSHRGIDFGDSAKAGVRHLRLAFTKPVVVGSVVTHMDEDIELSALRRDAAYPGDLADDAQWRAAWRPRRGDASVWVLPPGTTTRALRFSCSRTGEKNNTKGRYRGAVVLAHAVTSVATDARVAVSSGERVSLITDGDHGWFAPTNWQSDHEARNDTVSRERPEWVMLTWPRTVTLRGLNVLDAGFKSVDVFIYGKEGDPAGAADDEWTNVGTFKARCRYPSIIGPNWIDFGSVREVRAVKLVITDAHRVNELHPHRRKGYCFDGKCVWLGEILALKPFADSPLLGLIRRVGELGERAKANPKDDGYLLDTEIIYALATNYDADKVRARCIASAGGAVAASPNFDRSLTRSLTGSAGYSFPSRSGVARSRMSVPALLKGLGPYLARYKPEVVRVCFDTGSLQRVTDPKTLAPGVRDVVKRIQSAGAVPVLFTMPAPPFRDEKAEALIASYDEMIVSVAAELRVPYVDARKLLNSDVSKNFSRNGALRTHAYDAMNAAFHNLYWTLEASVFGRITVTRAPAAGKAASEKTTSRESDRPNAPPAGAAPRAPSVVPNGGFERRDDRTRFATGWRTHVWGEPDSATSIRLDRTNPHAGEHAMSALARRDGARPGAFIGVRLEAGTYEVRYWAQADVGKRAQIGCHLGGVDLAVQTVGDEWQQFTERVDVEKRGVSGSIKLWVQTRNVRVWFDDVEVTLVRAKTD